jgi:hypothetical protein
VEKAAVDEVLPDGLGLGFVRDEAGSLLGGEGR